MPHPIESLHLHCKYRSGQEICPACRKDLTLKAAIVKDFYGYGKHKIFRMVYFYSKMFDEIRMIWRDPPATLIEKEHWDILPLENLGIFDLHSKKADIFPDGDQFQDRLEELYTFEQFQRDAQAVAEYRAKKHKALF